MSAFEFDSSELEEWFPKIIGKNYKIFSIQNIDEKYNCVGFSLGVYNDFLWFNEKNWPPDLRHFSLKNFISFYELNKFEKCKDASLGVGYEKIAIYTIPYKAETAPTHVAKQFGNIWRSKIGNKNILEHQLEWISGINDPETSYGEVELFMKRKV